MKTFDLLDFMWGVFVTCALFAASQWLLVMLLLIGSAARAEPFERNEYTKSHSEDKLLNHYLNRKFKPQSSDVMWAEDGFTTYTSSHTDCSYTYYVDGNGITRDIKAEGTKCFGE